MLEMWMCDGFGLHGTPEEARNCQVHGRSDDDEPDDEGSDDGSDDR
jgi:hypothetical protein